VAAGQVNGFDLTVSVVKNIVYEAGPLSLMSGAERPGTNGRASMYVITLRSNYLLDYNLQRLPHLPTRHRQIVENSIFAFLLAGKNNS
jgi:hypothetical protein